MNVANNTPNFNRQKIVISPSAGKINPNWYSRLKDLWKKLKSIWLVLIISCVMSSCDEFNCSVDNTAEIRFENRTGTNTPMLIVLDGNILVKLEPGQISETYTINAGGHSIRYLHLDGITNTCNPSFVNLKACESKVFWCTY